ncbi:MAG: hypothetical protein AB2A00_23725 [Myxococcota bacterium]
MQLTLTPLEAQVLRKALDRHLQIMQDEVAHTEKISLQRELAHDIDDVVNIRRKLNELEREQALSGKDVDAKPFGRSPLYP